jgi:hypothetical protein
MASALSGLGIVEGIFSSTDRTIDAAEKAFTRVDVINEFSVLVTRPSPYDDVG